MTGSGQALRLVFTDLDGSLLDHDSYSYADALPQLRALERLGIPVILVSSKTRAEIAQLRQRLDHRHPFIVENGAAVFIPDGYFTHRPQQAVEYGGYWALEFCAPRSRWLELLEQAGREFEGEFAQFSRVGAAGIARLTGLSEAEAALANQRDFSEPLSWLGSAEREREFTATLRQRGASVQRGGRFLSVSGDCDKGRAVARLRGLYQAAHPGETCRDLAIGDSDNDRAMLEAAGTALLIRSPQHDFPVLSRVEGVLRSHACGPAGWAEGVARWLDATGSQR